MEVPQWASLLESITFPAEQPLFAVFQMPDTKNIDLDCPLGVSAFSDAVGFIRDADEQWERILWELESSERAIDASEDLFRFNPETNQPVLPKGRERMYHCLEATGEGGKTIYNTFSPEVRDNSYFHALNQIFRQIENTTGLSYGTISEVSDVEKTAEEVKISKQCSFVRVCDIQKNLQTALEQLAAAVSLQQAEDAGCYLMEITAHSGARPDHAKWQGQLVTITGKDAGKIIDGLRVFTLSEIGYGSGEGFKGWNCRHNWHAYYPGLSTPNYTQEELKKLDEPCISYNGKLYTEYEISQMQRVQERRVRAWKRRCITAQEGVNSATDEATRATAQAEFERSARYLKTNEAKLKDFCRQTGQDRDRFREQVLGFSRSEAQKAVHAAKKSGLTSGGRSGTINVENPLKIDMQFFGNRNLQKMKSSQLIKSIKSWKHEIEEHKDKISHPDEHYPLWDTFDERQQNGYKKHWEKEIQTMQNDVEQAIIELKNRGDYDE